MWQNFLQSQSLFYMKISPLDSEFYDAIPVKVIIYPLHPLRCVRYNSALRWTVDKTDMYLMLRLLNLWSTACRCWRWASGSRTWLLWSIECRHTGFELSNRSKKDNSHSTSQYEGTVQMTCARWTRTLLYPPLIPQLMCSDASGIFNAVALHRYT